MNREFYRNMARAQSVRSAQVARRPLSVWPGDPAPKVSELPDVSREYIEANPPDGTQTLAGKAPLVIEVGKRYGVVMQSYDVSKGLMTTVGVWNE